MLSLLRGVRLGSLCGRVVRFGMEAVLACIAIPHRYAVKVGANWRVRDELIVRVQRSSLKLEQQQEEPAAAAAAGAAAAAMQPAQLDRY